MTYSILPRMIIFQIQYVLFPKDISNSSFVFPCSKIGEFIYDDNLVRIEYYSEVTAVFKKLYSLRIKIAITDSISPNSSVHDADYAQLIELLDWNKYISFREVSSKSILDNLKKIERDSNILLNNTIYVQFDQTKKEFEDVFDGYVACSEEITINGLHDILESYESQQLKKLES